MVGEAKKKNADGIVCVRFTTSAVMQGAAELLVYGTAVKLKKSDPALRLRRIRVKKGNDQEKSDRKVHPQK